MLQARSETDLIDESRCADQGTDLGVEHLHRDAAIMLRVPREIDRGHPPAPDLPFELEQGSGLGEHSRGDAIARRQCDPQERSRELERTGIEEARTTPSHTVYSASSRCSQFLALIQSRLTVRAVTLSAAAVSSSVRPPKKRHSTTRTNLSSRAASRVSASS